MHTSGGLLKGSKEWLSRQGRDPFVRGRSAFVSRSAFKLLELQTSKRLLPLQPAQGVILDMGCAPGGWIQAARSVTRAPIIGVDLLPISSEVAEQSDVHFIQGDLRDRKVQRRIIDAVGTQKVGLVLSDMLHNVSGNPLRDSALSVELCEMTFNLAKQVGAFQKEHEEKQEGQERDGEDERPRLVLKCYQSGDADEFVNEVLKKQFRSVSWYKPKSSRPESREAYLLCAKVR